MTKKNDGIDKLLELLTEFHEFEMKSIKPYRVILDDDDVDYRYYDTVLKTTAAFLSLDDCFETVIYHDDGIEFEYDFSFENLEEFLTEGKLLRNNLILYKDHPRFGKLTKMTLSRMSKVLLVVEKLMYETDPVRYMKNTGIDIFTT